MRGRRTINGVRPFYDGEIDIRRWRAGRRAKAIALRLLRHKTAIAVAAVAALTVAAALIWFLLRR